LGMEGIERIYMSRIMLIGTRSPMPSLWVNDFTEHHVWCCTGAGATPVYPLRVRTGLVRTGPFLMGHARTWSPTCIAFNDSWAYCVFLSCPRFRQDNIRVCAWWYLNEHIVHFPRM
jgi:hypothetical protein